MIGRLGGDEFVALLSDADSVAKQEVTQRLMQLLEERNDEAQRGYGIRYGVGQIQYDAERYGSHCRVAFRSRRRDVQPRAGVKSA
ncbi:nucleotidyl cyclase domain-containing protein [Paraburkholderia rhynchosiae]|uniref:hypothetical protein n=1 Tax=Paraburkholderia rhynchosiae TaxID=487049 RepID=UPI001FD59578|nr:hypothetical protein [Paraburkholderia rhynchosiae]